MPAEREIRLLVADDHTIVRQGLRKLLETEPGVEVVGEATDGRDAVTKAMDLMPDIVLMDLSMPGLHGLEATRQITKRLPKTRVLILSMHKNEAYVLQALQSGASGFVLKDSASEEVLTAIRSVSRGDSYLSPSISRVLIEDYLRLSTPGAGGAKSLYDTLTVREREIFQLLAEGLKNQEIAERLHVSVKTVETHRAHIMEKLNLNNIAELVKYSIEIGIVQLDTSG
ncbi:response regulator transcription factor [Candidatus Sumerlaeota bacterium]|nr:response regulator transcription factor [Candidatus Sumerlaeota bacterium]HMZ50839.1 response regulator transcription factor [Candidatus Sumerlaeota bacterium]HNM46331.1 response regulator transcription factor [Candidatus Sumerlaeota bacterium]